MNVVIEQLLAGVELGEPKTAGPLTVVPLLGDLPLGPRYVTLAEALESETLEVTEVSGEGVVGTLRARNTGQKAVLILDGEELQGAKQNRVLNTTVLIGAGTTVDLPVSCTESGRWRYESRHFADSGYLSEPRVRAEARTSVTDSVRERGAYHSDQARVWDCVEHLCACYDVPSPTAAMRDVFESLHDELGAFTESVSAVHGQRGLLAVAGGSVLGFDLVSRPEAYARLHDRLVRSYGLAALGVRTHGDPVSDARAASAWLAALADLEGTVHESPGMGKAHRFMGRGVTGSALTFSNAIVHAAFLATPARG